jgi:hypothetical protein
MSIPFVDQDFTFTQPDGTELKVRGSGNQHQATFKTLDGYTVVQDPVSGFYQYAQETASHHPQPTGVQAEALDPTLLGVSGWYCLLCFARPAPVAFALAEASRAVSHRHARCAG